MILPNVTQIYQNPTGNNGDKKSTQRRYNSGRYGYVAGTMVAKSRLGSRLRDGTIALGMRMLPVQWWQKS